MNNLKKRPILHMKEIPYSLQLSFRAIINTVASLRIYENLNSNKPVERAAVNK